MVVEGRRLPIVQPDPQPAEIPIFKTIAIVGLGVIGGSVALAARRRWPGCLVIGVDRNEVLEQAMVAHAVDVAASDPVVIADADLVVLAAPVETNIELLQVVAEYVTVSAIVTDTSATKRRIVERSATLPPRLQFVGGSPLGGAARSGFEHARSDMFAGRPWILTPVGDGGGESLERVSHFVRELGAEPRVMTPTEHDRVMAAVFQLPQLGATAMMHAIGEHVGDLGLGLAGRGLIDSTRLASSSATVWTDICRTNADFIGSELDALIAVLQGIRDNLESATGLDDVFESANAWRRRLVASTDRQPSPRKK